MSIICILGTTIFKFEENCCSWALPFFACLVPEVSSLVELEDYEQLDLRDQTLFFAVLQTFFETTDNSVTTISSLIL